MKEAEKEFRLHKQQVELEELTFEIKRIELNNSLFKAKKDILDHNIESNEIRLEEQKRRYKRVLGENNETKN